MDGIKDAISDLVAEAVNSDFRGDNLAENILGLFTDGMTPAERETVFNESVVFMFCRGFPGCLPEASFAVSSGQDIREVILDELREAMDELDSDSVARNAEAALRCAMDDIESARDDELRRFGACMSLPGGMELSVQFETCAEIMRLNGFTFPDFGKRDPDGPK